MDGEPLDVGWAPDAVAAWAAQADFGEGMWTPFGPVQHGDLSRDGRLDLLIAWERTRAWVDAQQQGLLAALADDPDFAPAGDPAARHWVREEVACALRLSPQTAAARLADAADLTGRLPATLAAVAAGRITLLHARALVDAVRVLPDPVATAIEAAVLTRAGEQTVAEFKRSVARAVARHDPRDPVQQHTDAAAQRRVDIYPAEHGMAQLIALLPADGAALIATALDTAADRTATAARTATDRTATAARTAAARNGGRTDPRTMAQRRADALVDLATCTLHGHPDPHTGGGPVDLDTTGVPLWQGRRPTVQVTVALSTLLGLDHQPAELAGHGPIPAALALRIATDPTGSWQRLITDEHGYLLDHGRTRYRPPANLREHIINRDRTCRFPGCSRPARRCDIDHLQPYAHGGTTEQCNLHCLCSRHHHAKHDADWQTHRDHTGTTHWTSPTGRHYTKPPETHPTTRPPQPDNPDPPPPF